MWDADQVAALCYRHYEARLPKQGKPGRDTREWTELAAVVRAERAEGGGAPPGEALGREWRAGRVPGLRGPASRDLPFSPLSREGGRGHGNRHEVYRPVRDEGDG